MLTNSKDECVVDCEPCALRLHDIQVITLSVPRRMSKNKIIRWVVACMNDWKGKGKRMRDVSAVVHQSFPTRVYFDRALPFVAWQNRFDGESFLAAYPVWLHKGPLAHDISTFKEVSIRIAREGRRL